MDTAIVVVYQIVWYRDRSGKMEIPENAGKRPVPLFSSDGIFQRTDRPYVSQQLILRSTLIQYEIHQGRIRMRFFKSTFTLQLNSCNKTFYVYPQRPYSPGHKCFSFLPPPVHAFFLIPQTAQRSHFSDIVHGMLVGLHGI